MRDSNDQSSLPPVSEALKNYMNAVAVLPYPDCFDFIHTGFTDLTEHGFRIPRKPWLNPYELAHLVNYVALFGDAIHGYPARFELNTGLNALKKLWSLAEAQNLYSDNEDYIACFLLRWIYQQLPYCVDPRRVLRTCNIVRELLSFQAVSTYVESVVGLTAPRLMDLSILLLRAFQRHASYEESMLLTLQKPSADLRIVLELFSADRSKRLEYHRDKLEVASPIQKPYEINSLLQYPISRYQDVYYAPYPELIGYACARGLFFRFSELGRQTFRDPFADSMEQFTARLLKSTLPHATILTEREEREFGWEGKTNDISVIEGDAAILFECKASAFFVDTKRTASPEIIIADLRKNLANAEKRKGLFQLFDKREAIRNGALPKALMEKYKDVKRFFPVMLLFDAVEHVNAAQVVGNIIRDELRAHGITGFEYQIWHLEELSWLADFAGQSMVEWTAEKFRSDRAPIGLNSFISDRTGNAFLNQLMYMPQGNPKALKILTELSSREIRERSQ